MSSTARLVKRFSIRNITSWVTAFFRKSRTEDGNKLHNGVATQTFMSPPPLADAAPSEQVETTKCSNKERKSLEEEGEEEAEPPQASLMGIPGEIRNQIYRHALLQDTMIKVSPHSHEQPALLQTNRQIRKEALSIWMTENIFKVDAWDMKLTIPPNYKSHWLSCIQYKSFFITMRGGKDWGNLRDWLKMYSMHQVPGLAAGQPTTDAEILAQVFELVYRGLVGLSFEQMGPILDAWIRSVELAGVEFDFQ